MKRSVERILTTHAGSLPRPVDLIEMYKARRSGESVDEEARTTRLRSAVSEIVRQQAEIGVDVVDDGEFGKRAALALRRLARFGGKARSITANRSAISRD